MPSKLAKVQKTVNKKKGGIKAGALHENSRDAMRLRRAGARDDRVIRLSAIREKANRAWVERIMFFQDNLPNPLHPMEIAEIQAIATNYIARNDDELAQLKTERRSGRPASNRQTLLEQQKRTEESEYVSGFWLPNLQDDETLLKLEAWKGDWAGLANLRFIRIDGSAGVQESQFPPRGAS
ncbi:hypothetical protein K431DRAFT_306587 [Polychaeton citri CBS 116435]|uniref:Translation machinery-associated protein 16 n=1 Tax=Polychaeton citri CBS 116435 TaxID=1314669 RepID=A0A9P4ULJ0_9PEZI|nr:hypothetical protein K431DRAFT_306587 [Polychaeton citri CBS 116435]